jgi:hypothetical protein
VLAAHLSAKCPWEEDHSMKSTKLLLSILLVFATSGVWAQQIAPPQPIVNIRIARTIKSVTYRPNSGQSSIGFQGTALLPRAEGKARVQNKQGVTYIEGELSKLEPAWKFGSPYLTYVLWAITPEGSASNLGELVVDGTKAKIKASTNLQSFGLIVTAEPYFAIGIPSEIVVLENIIIPGTYGKIEAVDAKYELLERGRYEVGIFEPFTVDPKVPLELYQARNAARLGAWMQADKYATESWAKAQVELKNAEDFHGQKKSSNKKSVMMMARDATQIFEDARVIALKRQEDERLANERQAARERQERARAEAEEQAQRRKEEEEARRRAELEREVESARRERAEAEKIKAELATAQEAQRRAEAEAARTRAIAQEEEARRLAEQARMREEEAKKREEEARKGAEQARLAAEQAAREKAELRARLLQLNAV